MSMSLDDVLPALRADADMRATLKETATRLRVDEHALHHVAVIAFLVGRLSVHNEVISQCDALDAIRKAAVSHPDAAG